MVLENHENWTGRMKVDQQVNLQVIYFSFYNFDLKFNLKS